MKNNFSSSKTAETAHANARALNITQARYASGSCALPPPSLNYKIAVA